MEFIPSVNAKLAAVRIDTARVAVLSGTPFLYGIFYDGDLLCQLTAAGSHYWSEPDTILFGHALYATNKSHWVVTQATWLDRNIPKTQMPLSFYVRREIARKALFADKNYPLGIDTLDALVQRFHQTLEHLAKCETVLQISD